MLLYETQMHTVTNMLTGFVMFTADMACNLWANETIIQVSA